MNQFLKFVILITITLLIFQFQSCSSEQSMEINILPSPQNIDFGNGKISLRKGFRVETKEKTLSNLVDIINEDFYKLTGVFNAENTAKDSPKVILSLDKNLSAKTYHLNIKDNIKVTGGSYEAVSNGVVSFLQLLDEKKNVPQLSI